jgi:hypothetical protein
MSSSDSEKTPQGRRWRLVTSRPIDMAIAILVIAPMLHFLDLDSELAKLVISFVG